MAKIAITMGDPNSISPEIIIKALNDLDLPEQNIIIVGASSVLNYYEQNFDLNLKKKYEVVEIPFNYEDIKIGSETKEAGDFSFLAIKKACEMALEKKIKAIVTGPVSKFAMNLAGHHYSGQTEIIEKYIATQGQKAEMLFIMDNLKILLLTRHVAIKELPKLLKKDFIVEKISCLDKEFKEKLHIESPSFALCSLNPHAGENGLFGDEEIKEYIPAIKELKENGINIEGPFPSDGLFANIKKENSKRYDCYIASYHDQGLIPIKLLGMNSTVNTTIGLDTLRTSPAHGTAFDIAGKKIADEASMISAINIAINQ